MRSTTALAALFVFGIGGHASAQGFISPYLGTAFSKPPLEACSVTSGCEDGKRTLGVSIGSLGSIFGAEFDLGYTKAFFGETGDTASSGMTTLFGNLLVGPKIGPVQPYGLIGVGMLRMHVDSFRSSLTAQSENALAWDIGGGVIILFGGHVGIRGDLRHFRGMQDLDLVAVAFEGSDIKFNRASAAVVFKF
jgi:opacity protein-like surface antigen